MAMLSECFEVLGGVPRVVLADRMGCLKGGVVANRVVPTPEYVRFATHYRFRPDFCEAADPAFKGIVENLVSYAKDDLGRPVLLEHAGTGDLAAGAVRVLGDLSTANGRASTWCEQVNAVKHSEICAVPADRLTTEADLLTPLPSLRPSIGPSPATRKVDKLSTIRLGSARYSVPTRLIGTQVSVVIGGARVLVLDAGTGEVHAEHPLVAPVRPRCWMSTMAGHARPGRSWRSGPGARRRKSSARSGPRHRRSSPVLPGPGTPGWARSWPSSTPWSPRTEPGP